MQHARDRLERIIRHALIMLGGGAVSAVLALGALAVATRALSPAAFGVLALAQAYALLIERVGTFQSWQALIRFGALAREQSDRALFRGLVRFGFRLDVAGSLFGALLGAAVAALAGHRLGWDRATQTLAIAYAASVLFRISGTSLAVLRLLDRFDRTAVARAIGGVTRLAGGVVAAWMHAPLAAFAAVWIVADIVPSALMAFFARSALRDSAMLGGDAASVRAVRQRFPDLVGTFWTTNWHGTVKVVVRDVDVLLAGLIAGPSAAGLVRVARQLGGAVGQLADPFTQAIYPELAAAAAQGHTAQVRHLAWRTGQAGAAAGIAVALCTWMAASVVLRLTAGAAYVAAAPALVCYAIAQALSLATLSVSPALLALGRARRSFGVLCVATVVYGAVLFPAIRAYGATGAALALVLFQSVWGVLAVLALHRVTAPSLSIQPDAGVVPLDAARTYADPRAA